MSDLGRAFFSQYDCDHIESVRAVLDLVRSQKISGRTDYPGPLGAGDGRFRRAEVLGRPGLDLDKDQRAVAVDHDQVDFARFTEEIASERLETFAFEESLAVFLAPSAEPRLIRRQSAIVQPRDSTQISNGLANPQQIWQVEFRVPSPAPAPARASAVTSRYLETVCSL